MSHANLEMKRNSGFILNIEIFQIWKNSKYGKIPNMEIFQIWKNLELIFPLILCHPPYLSEEPPVDGFGINQNLNLAKFGMKISPNRY